MNTFNRIVMVLFFLILIPVMTAVLILPHVVMPTVGEWFSGWGEYFAQVERPWLRLVVGVLLAIVCDALAILLLVLEVRPRRKRFIRVQDVGGGTAAVSSASIISQLEYALDPLPGVIKVAPNVKVKKDKVQAVIDVDVTSSVNVPDLAVELMEIAQRVLSEELGLAVYDDPEVRIKVTENVKRRRTRAKKSQPVPAPTPTPEPESLAPPPLPITVEAEEEDLPEPWLDVTKEDVEESSG